MSSTVMHSVYVSRCVSDKRVSVDFGLDGHDLSLYPVMCKILCSVLLPGSSKA